jgi:HD-like signal output (HDOD) protein
MPTSPKQLIRKNLTLPTLPSVVARLNALVDDPAVGTREIGMAVAEDAPIAAKVLKIANSSLYGMREEIVSTEHASAVLGMRMLRTIAMQASVIRQFEHLDGGPDFDLTGLWVHSILTGQMCAAVSVRCRSRIGLAPDEFQVIGLLHDMGKILMLEALGEEFLAALREARERGKPSFLHERQRIGFDHATVGGLIAAQWGLPVAVVEAIEFHHAGPQRLARNPVSLLVAKTNEMLNRLESGDLAGAEATFDGELQRQLGLRPDDARALVELALELRPRIEV